MAAEDRADRPRGRLAPSELPTSSRGSQRRPPRTATQAGARARWRNRQRQQSRRAIRRRQRRRRRHHRLRTEDRLGLVGGGIIGTLLRVAVTGAVPSGAPSGVPWGTLTVNAAGTFILAFLLIWWSRSGDPPTRTTHSLHTAIARGVLGSFTTFSAFAVEVVTGAEVAPAVAAGYGLGSVAVGIGAAWAGARLVGRRTTEAMA